MALKHQLYVSELTNFMNFSLSTTVNLLILNIFGHLFARIGSIKEAKHSGLAEKNGTKFKLRKLL